MPYFAYISMLHLYESLGWWRAGAELRRVSQTLSACLPACLSVCMSVCPISLSLAVQILKSCISYQRKLIRVDGQNPGAAV